MRFLSIVASACALVAGAVAAQKSPEQRFLDFHGRFQAAAAPVGLDDASYKALTSAPRDYSVAVLLTALGPRFGCQLCREFHPEWDLIGRSWAKGDKAGESRMLFGTLDFADGRDSFLSLGLQTAPVLLFFPPTQGPHAAASRDPVRYDFTSGPPAAEQRPVNYLRWASAITFLLGIGTLAMTAGPYLLPIIQNRNLWAAGTMIAILLFVSGHMFNHIRKVPYVAGDGKGGITYFASGFQTQLGLETQIIAAIYGLLTFCTIALVTRIARMTNPQSQLVAALAWLVIMFVANSFLLSIFRIKNSGYPFSLPPFM
ncbi:OST3/OST6 family, transporter family protein [Hirsutella rhossiliensis]|uniref:OST3 / OST6 family, transporter family domain-containing protein n=1 Tax=Hirsutella rhossiliensis TaxID=111463 RepID=A0A9P8SNS8_9HYPO|nr:OST3 / OST6 family, transporter family domain-containing protein [Hirsutella rhossiliensis]KAH0967461.1 OST3 / OST6 family, transporter family domain-containing protein [Hirsutella rhossiliensis]